MWDNLGLAAKGEVYKQEIEHLGFKAQYSNIHLPNVRKELFFVNTCPRVSIHKVLEGKLQRLSYLARSMYK